MVKLTLETKKICKSFGKVNVLNGVDFQLRPGEVMGLVGENGAGKSTLMKIITGLYTLDEGEILLEGKKVDLSGPKDARNKGISIIHQEFNLFSDLSVAENIFLDRKDFLGPMGIVNWKKMYSESEKVLEELGAKIDVKLPAHQLSVREQQLVEIAKAISTNAKILIMDEPTAALPDNEVQNMFDVIRILKKRGVAIVYVSHRMKEITEICDRVTVLRDGKNVGVVDVSEDKIDEIITLMVGREISDYYPRSERSIGNVVLKVDNLSNDGKHKVSFEVRQGEVVSLFGLAGSGATEVAEMIMGIRKYNSGSIMVNGANIEPGKIKNAISGGISYVPPDRKQEGLVLQLPIRENLILSNTNKYCDGIILNKDRISESTDKNIKELGIKCAGGDQLVGNLSGGNQQKVVLAKWLDSKPKLLILNEPTRGVDVGAKAEIYRLIDSLALDGLAILLITSEMPEALGISDRIIVINRGNIVAESENEGLTQEYLLKAASGTARGNMNNG